MTYTLDTRVTATRRATGDLLGDVHRRITVRAVSRKHALDKALLTAHRHGVSALGLDDTRLVRLDTEVTLVD